MREKIFGHLPKTDEVEARVMARIAYLHEVVSEEFTLKPLQLPNPEQEELLSLCRNSWKLKTMVTRARNQFAQLMAVVFPELKFFFESSVSSLVPIRLMASYPSPAEIANAPADELYAVLWKARGYQHAKRVQELQALARNTSGLLPDPGRAWRLNWLTQFLLSNVELLSQLDQRIERLCENHPDYPLLVGIPYAGPNTLGTILAATGDCTRFQNYRQYVAYTGYFAGLERSQTIDRTQMSRRGNRDLKRAYFQIVAPLVWFDPGDNAYKNLYKRKMAQGRAWYEAMPFACAALARHVYHCLKFQEPYQVEKAFGRDTSWPTTPRTQTNSQADLEQPFEIMDAHLSSIEPQ
jgi:transposase